MAKSSFGSVAGRVLERSWPPELYLAILAFAFNFVWEMWQIPFYKGMMQTPHWEGVKFCTLASMGDTIISLAAYSASSLLAKNRRWIAAPRAREFAMFLGFGIAVTIVIEALATGPLARWEYTELMPVVPWIGTGALPLLQWLVIPAIESCFLLKIVSGGTVNSNYG